MKQAKKIQVYKDIAEQIKKKYKIDFSIEEIHSVTQSQFKMMGYGFSKGIGIHIPYIGKFVPFDMDTYSADVIIPNKILQQELRDAGKEEEATTAYMESYEKYKKIKSQKANEIGMTAEEVIAVPNVDESNDNLDLFRKLRQ